MTGFVHLSYGRKNTGQDKLLNQADSEEHADAVFPPDSDNGGEPVHGAGGAEYPGGGGLRHLQRGGWGGDHVQLFERGDGHGQPTVLQLRLGAG